MDTFQKWLTVAYCGSNKPTCERLPVFYETGSSWTDSMRRGNWWLKISTLGALHIFSRDSPSSFDLKGIGEYVALIQPIINRVFVDLQMLCELLNCIIFRQSVASWI